jgi:hypothetical protein
MAKTVPSDPFPVHNRTVLHLLKALQFLEMKVPGGGRESRRLSFHALDIEQIGHVYEAYLITQSGVQRKRCLGSKGTKNPRLPCRN